MDTNTILIGLAGVLAAAAPVLFAVLGETITERAGIINLSMNGSILLSAMGGFAVAQLTGSLMLGFLARHAYRRPGGADRGIQQHHPAPIPGGSRIRAGTGGAGPFLFPGCSLHE